MDKIEEAAEKYAMSDNIPARSQHINIHHIAPTFIAGALSLEAKEYWQQGMYSEEEVLDLLIDFFSDHTNAQNANILEWFSQNKKK